MVGFVCATRFRDSGKVLVVVPERYAPTALPSDFVHALRAKRVYWHSRYWPSVGGLHLKNDPTWAFFSRHFLNFSSSVKAV